MGPASVSSRRGCRDRSAFRHPDNAGCDIEIDNLSVRFSCGAPELGHYTGMSFPRTIIPMWPEVSCFVGKLATRRKE